jgi:hypothetical protein
MLVGSNNFSFGHTVHFSLNRGGLREAVRQGRDVREEREIKDCQARKGENIRGLGEE